MMVSKQESPFPGTSFSGSILHFWGVWCLMREVGQIRLPFSRLAPLN